MCTITANSVVIVLWHGIVGTKAHESFYRDAQHLSYLSAKCLGSPNYNV